MREAPADAGRPGRLTEDGRDPVRVPENWRELLDPTEWRLNAEGLPARRAARVIALRREPEPAILLVTGHDFGDSDHWWAFTPGGGIMPGEEPREAAVREMREETGVVLAPAELVGPVVRRSSRFVFNLVTARQNEEMFLVVLDPHRTEASEGADGEMNRSGWTDLEQEVLDSLRWWRLDELEDAAANGTTVYPEALPGLARELLRGWDGVVREILEED